MFGQFLSIPETHFTRLNIFDVKKTSYSLLFEKEICKDGKIFYLKVLNIYFFNIAHVNLMQKRKLQSKKIKKDRIIHGMKREIR